MVFIILFSNHIHLFSVPLLGRDISSHLGATLSLAPAVFPESLLLPLFASYVPLLLLVGTLIHNPQDNSQGQFSPKAFRIVPISMVDPWSWVFPSLTLALAHFSSYRKLSTL